MLVSHPPPGGKNEGQCTFNTSLLGYSLPWLTIRTGARFLERWEGVKKKKTKSRMTATFLVKAGSGDFSPSEK